MIHESLWPLSQHLLCLSGNSLYSSSVIWYFFVHLLYDGILLPRNFFLFRWIPLSLLPLITGLRQNISIILVKVMILFSEDCGFSEVPKILEKQSLTLLLVYISRKIRCDSNYEKKFRLTTVTKVFPSLLS